jgi:hypothetical protein
MFLSALGKGNINSMSQQLKSKRTDFNKLTKNYKRQKKANNRRKYKINDQ